jgi:hypothetical protein
MANVYSVLSADSDVTAIAGTRIFPATVPKSNETFPAIVFKFVGGASTPTMDTFGMQRSRLQVDCLADDYADAIALRTAVVRALSGYTTLGFQSQVFNATTNDGFDRDLEQYVAICEFYVFTAN